MAFKEKQIGSDGGEQFKFDKPGTTLTGYYVGSQNIIINKKPATRHDFQTKAGERISPLGSYNLDKGLAELELGTMVRVTYVEKKQTNNGNTVKVFKLEVDEDDTIEVTGTVRPPTTAQKIDSLKSKSA